jgi:hypothetical protein
MLFHSAQFLIFFPIVTVLYYAVPGKLKHAWLQAFSHTWACCFYLNTAALQYAWHRCCFRKYISSWRFRHLIFCCQPVFPFIRFRRLDMR